MAYGLQSRLVKTPRSRISCETPVPAPWEWVETVRLCVEEGLAELDDELRYAAILAASELAENVVKYGDGGAIPAGIDLELDGQRLRIRSVNRVSNRASAEEVMTIVDGIAATSDPATLYLQQMEAALRDPGASGSRLGFYRIAAEGGLRLSHMYVEGCLTITAERELT